MQPFKSLGCWAMAIIACLAAGCAAIDIDRPKPVSTAITDTADTPLGQLSVQAAEQFAGQSAFYPLNQGMDALGIRLRLAELAERSIDLQYFLMKNDTAGAVMARALLAAADRDVRVRFLIDDVFTTVDDESFLLIDQHPNIDIRIFNPVSRRGFYALNFIAQFNRANRRMHNKSFTVDNAASIVGGRNLADEYFQLKTDAEFVDFEVLAVGPIAAEISTSFDEYWNHQLAVPIGQFIDADVKADLETVRAEIAEEFHGITETVYRQALDSRLLDDLRSQRQTFYAGKARLLADSPDKLVNEVNPTHMRLAMELREVLFSAEKQILFVSPYYVPGDNGVQLARDLVDNGVRVMILTNSLASTNHIPVHSAYARYRRAVIDAGVELYEARADAARELNKDSSGPETLTLHSKVAIIDRRKLFVGSLNLDPRSIELNAEMGLLIEAPEMVRELTRDMAADLAALTYRVRVNDAGKLEWHGRIDDRDVVEREEPLTGPWRRFKAWLMRIVPERQL